MSKYYKVLQYATSGAPRGIIVWAIGDDEDILDFISSFDEESEITEEAYMKSNPMSWHASAEAHHHVARLNCKRIT